ncbi:hypothetical protein U9M48_020622 [Paspalum notatum var. saurae]|uniref:Uncharacterized protein n=1 Tax=Paspalum notatum var. saurae TaxID=547442 RepID=A0AAQ3TGJ4_PASNO
MDVPVSHFMEVYGISENNQAICAEICTDFGPSFDAKAFDGLCKLASDKFKHISATKYLDGSTK